MQAKIKNKKTLLQQLDLHKSEIKSFGVKSLSLFGSFANDRMNDDSDVDFLVEFEPAKKIMITSQSCHFTLNLYWAEKLNWLLRNH